MILNLPLTPHCVAQTTRRVILSAAKLKDLQFPFVPGLA